MSYFLQNGDMFAPTPGRESVLDTLPVGNYIVVETMQGPMFKRAGHFGDPGRMYGNINSRAERILNTFMDRPRTTGVLLSGEKGSGKSQLARNVSRLGYERNLPTILVNAPFCGDAFNTLLASIEQPAIIVMDEFEKVYSERSQQEQVLTLLDGVMTSQKLFILTVNDKFAVNEHMRNRPGRIFYAIEFDGLEPEFIREYCGENLDDTTQIENVLRISSLFKAFNFDMLKALVEEMNRYKEDAFDAIEMLNAKPLTESSATRFEVVALSPAGFKSEVQELTELPMSMRGGQMGAYLNFDKTNERGQQDKNAYCRDMSIEDDEYDDEETHSRHVLVQTSDLKKVDVDAGRYEFVNKDGFTITFHRAKNSGYDLRSIDAY